MNRGYGAAIYVGTVALLVGPVALRNSLIVGDPMITNSSGGIALYISWNPDANGSFNIPRFIPPNLADTPEKQRVAYRRLAENRLGGDAAALIWRKLELFLNHYEIWNNRSVLLARPFSWVLRLPLLGYGVILPLALAGIALVGSYDALRQRAWARLGVAALIAILSAGFVQRDIWDDDLSMAHYNLANKYKDLERWDLAVAEYHRPLALRPGAISFHNNLALVYERSGTYPEEAKREWRTVLRLARAQGRPVYIERATRHLRSLE